MQDRKVAVALMLSAMLASDFLIGFHDQMLSVYFSYLVLVSLGFLLSSNSSRVKIAGFAVMGSFIFYVISNFGVWYAGTLYPLTAAGLVDCYIQALPFYRNQLLSDVVSSVVIFEVARAVGVFAPAKVKV